MIFLNTDVKVLKSFHNFKNINLNILLARQEAVPSYFYVDCKNNLTAI